MKPRTDRARARGFTLLEILCVVALLGMAGMMVMLTLPHNNHQRQDEYQRIKNQIAQTIQQAQLTGNIYGLRLRPDGWEMVVLRRNLSAAPPQQAESGVFAGYHWQPVNQGRRAIRHQLSSDLQLTLLTETQRFSSGEATDAASAPQVLFLPGGEVTPFRFYLRDSAGGQAEAGPVIHIDDRGRVVEPANPIADRSG